MAKIGTAQIKELRDKTVLESWIQSARLKRPMVTWRKLQLR